MRRNFLVSILGIVLLCVAVLLLGRGKGADSGPGGGTKGGATSRPANEEDEAARQRLRSLGYLN